MNDNPETPLALTNRELMEIELAKRSEAEKIESCVMDLKAGGMAKDKAFAVCTASVKGKKKASEGGIASVKLTEPEITLGIEALTALLKGKGFNESDALVFASNYCKVATTEDFDSTFKIFQEGKNPKAHTGESMGMEDMMGEGGTPHTHTYALINLNYGQMIVGVTTGTKKAKDHAHLISICLDSKIRKMVADMNYGEEELKEEKYSYHRHSFEVDLEVMRQSIPSVFVMENRSFAEPKAQEPAVKMNSEKILFTSSFNKTFCFSCKREAEVMLAGLCQLFHDKSGVEGCPTEEHITEAYMAVGKEYPQSSIFNEACVAEAELNIEKLFAWNFIPKAKAKDKTAVAIPAAQAKDKKDHFPLNNEAQAKNALARVAQFNKVPAWWSGSLESLQKKVRSAVKKAFPKIDTKGMAEHYSVRVKLGDYVAFIPVHATTLNDAKEDAQIYASNCPSFNIDLVKFSEDGEGKQSFEAVGSLLFYDTRVKGLIETTSEEVKLSERDSDNNVVVEILRTGKFSHPEYGILDINDDMLNKVCVNFNDRVLDRDVSFDFNHEAHLPAAAWCRKLSMEKRPIKGNMQTVLKAHMEPTPRGEEALRNKDFLYFSSEYVDNFVDKENGKDYGITLKGGGLTNRPWIPGLKPIELSEPKAKVAFVKQAVR